MVLIAGSAVATGVQCSLIDWVLEIVCVKSLMVLDAIRLLATPVGELLLLGWEAWVGCLRCLDAKVAVLLTGHLCFIRPRNAVFRYSPIREEGIFYWATLAHWSVL